MAAPDLCTSPTRQGRGGGSGAYRRSHVDDPLDQQPSRASKGESNKEVEESNRN